MGRTVLITGATSGIGRELATLFAADGYHVVLTARSGEELAAVKEQLEAAYSVRVSCCPIDLSVPSGPELLMTMLQEDGITVDVLVNNAGFGVYGPFAATSLEAETAMLDLHVRSLTCLTKYMLPAMLGRRDGGILNVSSTAAFQPGPLMAVYYATKSYVLSFTESLACELAGTGVRVMALCPGPTETSFSARANLSAVKLFAGRRMKASDVARRGYHAFHGKAVVAIPGFGNNLLALSVRFMPRRLCAATVKWLHRRA